MNNCSNLMTRRLSGFLKNKIDDHMSIRLMDTRSCQFCFNPLCLVRAFVWYRSCFFFSFKPDCSIRICPSDGSNIWYKWTINCVDVHQTGHFWHLTRRLIVENHDFGEQNEAIDFRANYPLVIQHFAMENQHFLRWFFPSTASMYQILSQRLALFQLQDMFMDQCLRKVLQVTNGCWARWFISQPTI